MEQARKLIAVFHELNGTGDRNVARLTPSLVGMFGSLRLLDAFLSELDIALTKKNISVPLKKRAINLADTFIPQVAGYNGIKEFDLEQATPEHLRAIRVDSPVFRVEGAVMILAALTKILAEVRKID